jgi:hypothetical protein
LRGSVCQAEILDIDKELQGHKLYENQESEVARFCLACIMVGAKKTTVRMLSEPIKFENFKKYWKNLERNHYFKQDKTVDIEDLVENDVPFLLMMNCAKGILERKEA